MPIKTVLLALFLIIQTIPSQADTIGKVIAIQGNPIVFRGNHRLPLGNKVRLRTGDEIVTPKSGKVRFRLKDNTVITLASNTQFKLSKYTFDKTTSDVKFRLAKGAFQAITGAIGKQANPKFEVETRVATLGIRGTEFWGGFIFSDALDVTMLSGKGVYIKNEFGQVELVSGGEGTTVQAGSAPTAPKSWPESKMQRAKRATTLIPDLY